ncbi:MAG: tail fiber domain-containing protein [Deltaproteobacteria bacterium]|nr:tail fiber domain-containing protein [Deltaproteobacteria bacterium]
MPKRPVTGFCFLIALFTVGCSDSLPPLLQQDGAVDTHSDTTANVDLPPRDGTPPDLLPHVCPSMLPMEGALCTREGLICEYGEDPRAQCRTRALCQDGSWSIALTGCPPPITAECPATREQAAGELCDVMDAFCDYEGLICHCTNCFEGPVGGCGGDPTWHCDAPHPDPDCPAVRPLLGSLCAPNDLMCAYDCGAGNGRICVEGAWYETDGGPCPISTRRAKKEIRYLGPAALQKVARKTLELKLATYRYKDPALGKGAQLGFILEDAGQSFAGDPARGRVNLYGYTSMLLATVQAQQRAIERLRRDVTSLRREMKR